MERDYYMTPEEGQEYGIIDAVVTAAIPEGGRGGLAADPPISG